MDRIAKSVKRRALSLYKKAKGMSVREICEEVGVSTSTLNRWAQCEGLSRPVGKIKRKK